MHFSNVRRLHSGVFIFTPLLQSTYCRSLSQKSSCMHGIFLQQKSNKTTTCFNFMRFYHLKTSLLIDNTIQINVQRKHMLCNVQSYVSPFISARNINSNPKTELSELEEFDEVLNLLCKDLMSEQNSSISEALKWHLKVLQYNVKNGKKVRGLAVGKTYKILAGDSVTQHNLHLAHVLGWCVEMLQAFFLICDDIMDNSTMRRGEPCWYKKATRKTVYGQCLDMLSNPCNKTPLFETFTPERHNAIVEYKTSYYTYCLPVHLAMHLIGKFNPEDFQITNHLCLKLGLLFQVQDDYLDCFGDPKLTGKVGNDIKEGKCTWFVVQALKEANEDTRKQILENYGLECEEAVSKVHKIYEQLHLKEKYLKFEENMYNEIKSHTSQLLGSNSTQKLFDYLLQKTYKRNK